MIRVRGDYSSMPVSVGEVVDVVIQKLGNEGDGIAKIGSFIIIVPGTRVGEKVQCKITKTVNTCAFAKIL